MSTQNETLDLSSESFLREPHAAYRQGREQCPVYRVPDQNVVMVFGYDEVLEALMKPKVFSSKNEESILGASAYNPKCQEIYKTGWPQVPTLLNNDPPSHTRFKKLVNQAFTRERVAGMQDHIETMADRLIGSECTPTFFVAITVHSQLIASAVTNENPSEKLGAIAILAA